MTVVHKGSISMLGYKGHVTAGITKETVDSI